MQIVFIKKLKIHLILFSFKIILNKVNIKITYQNQISKINTSILKLLPGFLLLPLLLSLF